MAWAFLTLLFYSAAYCDSNNAIQSSACPGAAAWIDAHREQLPQAAELRDAARTFTEPELRKQLQQRFETEQSARREYLSAPQDQSTARKVDSLDADNLRWLKTLVKNSGVPTAQQVGERGVEWVWLLAQHADRDPQFQASLLPLFVQRYEAGELPADNVAKLTDRVLIARHEPQRFGTQFDWKSGNFKMRNSGELAQFNANRKQLGLMPLEDYACMMNERLKNQNSRE
jgi:hypothetical protein